jgi:hypothetical protein
MIDICERPVDDDGDADCPLCLATLALSDLIRVHLVTHLEELALFVLPCTRKIRRFSLLFWVAKLNPKISIWMIGLQKAVKLDGISDVTVMMDSRISNMKHDMQIRQISKSSLST